MPPLRTQTRDTQSYPVDYIPPEYDITGRTQNRSGGRTRGGFGGEDRTTQYTDGGGRTQQPITEGDTTYGPRDDRSGIDLTGGGYDIDQLKIDQTLGSGVGDGNLYDMLMQFFMQQPAYQIPQEVFDIMSLSTQTAETLARLYSGQREDVLGRLDVEGLRAIDILGQSKVDQLREARSMGKQMMGAYEEGMGKSLDILSQQAYGGLPGEQQYLENLQAGTASTVNALLQRGGGTGATLGAIADVYTGQQGEMRNLAAQRAQYQAQGMTNLAGGYQQYGQGKASIYETLGQTRIGIRTNMDQVLANTRIGLANQYANAYQSTTGALGSAIDRGTQLMTNALGGIADKRDLAFNVNYLEPYQYTRQFLVNELSRNDYSREYINMLGQGIAQTYGMQMQGVAGQSQGVSGILNAPASALGSYYQMKTLDAWNQNPTQNIPNPANLNTPQYDYTPTNFNYNPNFYG